MKKEIKKRLFLLGILSVFLVAWNVALSTQRKNLGGRFFRVEEKEVHLKINAPGKIEPKFQKTIISTIKGRKLKLNVRVGESVKKGQLLMTISDEHIKLELTDKRNSLQNARARFLKAKKDYQLEKSLLEQQAVSQREVENSRQSYREARQAFQSAKEDMKITRKKAKGVKLFAPINGVVVKNTKEREERINEGDEIFTIAKLNLFSVRGKVDELDIARVVEGQDALIKCDAFPDIEFQGKVNWIGAQADEGGFPEIDVLIDIVDTKGQNFKPNLTADATIVTGTIPNGIVVPSRAIRSGPGGPYVLLQRFGGWLAKQDIEIAQTNVDEAVIKSGLRSSQKILVPKEE